MYMCARGLNISDVVHPNQRSRLGPWLGYVKTPMGKATNRPGLPDDKQCGASSVVVRIHVEAKAARYTIPLLAQR
jgi:hypothetical protein